MDNSTNEGVMFREEQRFTQPWIWAVILPIDFLVLALFVGISAQRLGWAHIWQRQSITDGPEAIAVPVIMIFMFCLTWLLYMTRMTTEVRADGVYLRFYPLKERVIAMHDILSCQARTYRPIAEYGGWGIRVGRNGRAYNVSGNRGVQLTLGGDQQLLIGSQRADELANAIAKACKS